MLSRQNNDSVLWKWEVVLPVLRDSSVNIANKFQPGQLKNPSSFQGRGKKFFCPLQQQAILLYNGNLEKYFPESKAAGA